MQALYSELWGNPGGAIQEFHLDVPEAKYGFRPGYKMCIRKPDMCLPEFPSRTTSQVFSKLQTEAHLPCGVRKLLVRDEYINIHRRLNRAYRLKWLGSRNHKTDPAPQSQLDYEVAGQPGSGE